MMFNAVVDGDQGVLGGEAGRKSVSRICLISDWETHLRPLFGGVIAGGMSRMKNRSSTLSVKQPIGVGQTGALSMLAGSIRALAC